MTIRRYQVKSSLEKKIRFVFFVLERVEDEWKLHPRAKYIPHVQRIESGSFTLTMEAT